MATRNRKLPFEGLRVADFAWVGVGPTVSKYLADHGAEVIRIESATYPEALRRVPPFAEGIPGVDRSGYYANFNSSKLGVTINMNHPRGPEVAKRLIAECDVVTESFTPGAMDKWGLDYESVRAIREDIVYVSLPLFGSSGPWRHYSGYGHSLQAASGYNHLTGWPDRPPIGTGIAYTDFLVPHIAATGVIAALDYRRRTGKGQLVDIAQFEAAIHGLWTAVLDYTANGREQERLGNRDPEAAPHGAYRCKDGRYVVIACFTEKEWEGFRAALGRPDWVDLERNRRKWQRIENQREIDQFIGWWAAELTSAQAFKRMREHGVPSGIVKSPEEVHRDVQLRHRGHYWKLQHPAMGERTYDGPAFRLSKTPGRLSKAAPCLGEDNFDVFTRVVGMSEDEIASLVAEGVLE